MESKNQSLKNLWYIHLFKQKTSLFPEIKEINGPVFIETYDSYWGLIYTVLTGRQAGKTTVSVKNLIRSDKKTLIVSCGMAMANVTLRYIEKFGGDSYNLKENCTHVNVINRMYNDINLILFNDCKISSIIRFLMNNRINKDATLVSLDSYPRTYTQYN